MFSALTPAYGRPPTLAPLLPSMLHNREKGPGDEGTIKNHLDNLTYQ